MEHLRKSFVLPLLACLLLSSACVKQGGQAGPLDVYRNGKLDEAGTDIADVAYVNVRDSTALVNNLHDEIAQRLRTHGIELTQNPSQAGYILQISVLTCAPSATEILRQRVDAGYGAPADLSGAGNTALVTDALLVLRRVPRAGKKQALRNISNRQAVASSQMRLGLQAHKVLDTTQNLPPDIGSKLAAEICTPILHHAAGTEDPHAAAEPAATDKKSSGGKK
ncbi:complement resistance protein TraT [uncultured Desulfovibrio sp.]|uniref:complement resistance protein TraT n=1 Tax=uncultured Desulfovibrio sp. TaxID=167968 RepID=UPI002638EC03|nr:complement resistance protein TraT [uncultured Desulfovibrio sp.]